MGVQNLNQNSCRALTAVAQPCWSTTLHLVGGRSIARGPTAASARRSAAPHPGRSSTGIGVTGRSPNKGSRKRCLKSCIRQFWRWSDPARKTKPVDFVPLPHPANVEEKNASPDQDLGQMLEDGKIDALISADAPKCILQNPPKVALFLRITGTVTRLLPAYRHLSDHAYSRHAQRPCSG